MDAAEFVTVGGKIVELGSNLEQLRAQRETLNVQIEELERQLVPLLAKHSELVAAVMGRALPMKPVVAPALPPPPSLLTETEPAPTVDRVRLKRQILQLIDNSEEQLSATEISEKLKVDAVLVREVMRSLRQP